MKFSKRTQQLDWDKNKHQPTRRDVIKGGLASGFLYFVPSVLSQMLMSREALAGASFNNTYIVQIDASNGYASHGQLIPATVPGTSLSAAGLTQLGVTTDWMSRANNMYTAMGLPFIGTGNAALANTQANAASFVSQVAAGVVGRGGSGHCENARRDFSQSFRR